MFRKLIIAIGVAILLIFLGILGWSILLSMLNTNAFAPKVKLSETEESFIAAFSNECRCEIKINYDHDYIYKEGGYDTTPIIQPHYTPPHDSLRPIDTVVVIPSLGIPEPIDTAKERLLERYAYRPERLTIELQWRKGKGYKEYHPSDDICQKDSTSILQHAQKLANQLLPNLQHKNAYTGLRIYYVNYHVYDKTLTGSDCHKFVDFKIEGNTAIYEFSSMQ